MCFRYAAVSTDSGSGVLHGHLGYGQRSDEDPADGLVGLGAFPLRHQLSERPAELHQVQRPITAQHWCWHTHTRLLSSSYFNFDFYHYLCSIIVFLLIFICSVFIFILVYYVLLSVLLVFFFLNLFRFNLISGLVYLFSVNNCTASTSTFLIFLI